MELHFLVDTVHCGGRADVLADGIAVRDAFVPGPWPPREAKGVEIRVGAEAGVIEEIPSASYAAASFEDGEVG